MSNNNGYSNALYYWPCSMTMSTGAWKLRHDLRGTTVDNLKESRGQLCYMLGLVYWANQALLSQTSAHWPLGCSLKLTIEPDSVDYCDPVVCVYWVVPGDQAEQFYWIGVVNGFTDLEKIVYDILFCS
jgi:hypothetical protein